MAAESNEHHGVNVIHEAEFEGTGENVAAVEAVADLKRKVEEPVAVLSGDVKDDADGSYVFVDDGESDAHLVVEEADPAGDGILVENAGSGSDEMVVVDAEVSYPGKESDELEMGSDHDNSEEGAAHTSSSELVDGKEGGEIAVNDADELLCVTESVGVDEMNGELCSAKVEDGDRCLENEHAASDPCLETLNEDKQDTDARMDNEQLVSEITVETKENMGSQEEINESGDVEVSDVGEESGSLEMGSGHESHDHSEVGVVNSSSSEVVDEKERRQIGVSWTDEVPPIMESSDVVEDTGESCAEKVEDEELCLENEQATGDPCFAILNGGKEELGDCTAKETSVSEIVAETKEKLGSQLEACGSWELSITKDHDQVDSSMAMTDDIVNDEQANAKVVIQLPLEEVKEDIATIEDEFLEQSDVEEEEGKGCITTIEDEQEERSDVEETVMEETAAVIDETCNGGLNITKGHDLERDSLEVTTGIVGEKQIDVDSVKVLVEAETREELDITVTEFVGSEFLVLENERVMLDPAGDSPCPENPRDLRSDLELQSQEGVEPISRNAFEEQAQIVLASTVDCIGSTSDCIGSEVEANTSENSECTTYTPSGGKTNDCSYDNLRIQTVDGTELEAQVPCSQSPFDVCSESCENAISWSSREVTIESKNVHDSINANPPEPKCSLAEEGLANDAKDGNAENGESIDNCEEQMPASSCSVEEAEMKFLTTQALIKQWESADACDEDVISSADIGVSASSSPDNCNNLLEEDNHVLVQTSKDSPSNQSKHVDKYGCTQEVTADEILPSIPGDASNPSMQGVTVDSDAKRLPCYMIRVPKFFDDKLMARKEVLELEVNEKTQSRDSIKSTLLNKKATRDEYSRKLDAARKEEKAARDLFIAKRQEIDAIQNTINKLKNATSIDEIDDKIINLERRIQHETIPLREEKLLIREIKSLRQNRDQISSSLGSQAEMLAAFDKKEQIQEQFEHLKQELHALREEMLRVEMNTRAIKKKYDDECQALGDLYAQRDAANDLRQETYSHLRSVKKEYLEKNAYFYKYKDDRRAADNYASSGNKEALRHHCANQVVTFMELWNSNDEFRNQYVKFNRTSTLRRFKTLDGRSLGLDEEPTLLPNVRGEKQKGASLPLTESELPVSPPETKQEKKVELVLPEKADLQSSNKVTWTKRSDTPKSLNFIPVDDMAVATSSVMMEVENEKKIIEEDELTEKAKEVARQEEELRKELAAAELKERIRLEQIAKAKDAEERKRRKAEKAKARAEFKSQREADLKEKKKAKKENRKGKKVNDPTETTTAGSEAESLADASTLIPETTRESEVKFMSISRRPSKTQVASVKQNNKVKPLPIPLRSRGKRKMQTWMWMLVAAVLVAILFLAGNYISFSELKLPKFEF